MFNYEESQVNNHEIDNHLSRIIRNLMNTTPYSHGYNSLNSDIFPIITSRTECEYLTNLGENPSNIIKITNNVLNIHTPLIRVHIHIHIECTKCNKEFDYECLDRNEKHLFSCQWAQIYMAPCQYYIDAAIKIQKWYIKQMFKRDHIITNIYGLNKHILNSRHIYVSGSVCLTYYDDTVKNNDIDIYIEHRIPIHELRKLLIILIKHGYICQGDRFDLDSAIFTARRLLENNASHNPNYIFNKNISNMLTVINKDMNTTIDLIIISGSSIPDYINSFDFNMLKNYIHRGKLHVGYEQDIINKHANINIDKSIQIFSSIFDFNSFIKRYIKYTNRGYKIFVSNIEITIDKFEKLLQSIICNWTMDTPRNKETRYQIVDSQSNENICFEYLQSITFKKYQYDSKQELDVIFTITGSYLNRPIDMPLTKTDISLDSHYLGNSDFSRSRINSILLQDINENSNMSINTPDFNPRALLYFEHLWDSERFLNIFNELMFETFKKILQNINSAIKLNDDTISLIILFLI